MMFRQTLPAGKYEQFVTVLLAQTQALESRLILQEQQLAQSPGGERVATEPGPKQIHHFLVILSKELMALLIAEVTELPGFLTLELSFSPEKVLAFIQHLPPAHQPPLLPQAPQPNLQTLQLTQAILTDLLALCAADLSPQTSSCQPQVNLAVQQRIQRERLIHEITTQIRQSLELPNILSTAVNQIRDFLQADRVLIVQQGDIQYEALSLGAWGSLLGLRYPDWGDETWAGWSRLRSGESLAISDVECHYEMTEAGFRFWQQHQVKSLLIVPILVQSKLWGLLIADHCQHPRIWYAQEQEFLSHTCNHISIAIYQSQLYSQLQQQKATLEDRVAERTQALRQSILSAEAAQRVKSDFLATISHELRSPLTCVIGMSATLLRWPLGPLTEKQRHYLETIHDSGTHLLELINRILELSQVEVGQTGLRIQLFSLSQLARQVIQRVRAMAIAAQLNVQLELDVPPDADTFTADPHRLQQILIHLLTNAIKFTPAQGTVSLRVSVDAAGACFAVTDTGIGIPSHLQPLLFQLFQQLDTPYRRLHDGMGLGLAFTKQIVDLHQGTITVKSEEQHGSTFTVYIPRQAWEPTLTLSPTHPPEGRIILIEDQEENATLICELLTAAGYQVIWITDPVIEQLSHFQPLIVIASPSLDQFDLNRLIQHLHQTPATQHTKVLLLYPQPMTVKPGGEPGSSNQCPLDLGADAYLPYPIDPEALLAQITGLLSSETNPVRLPLEVS